MLLAVLMCFSLNCERSKSDHVQGYVEGEYVYVASPLAGMLTTLAVQRGDNVKAGDSLFALESGSEKATFDQAERMLSASRANLADIRKGRRPSEIESLEAQLKQAKADAELAQKDFDRLKQTSRDGLTSQQELDRATAARDRDAQRITQIQADLQTAKLGAREDQIAAAEAQYAAMEAALKKAQWDLSQKKQDCTQAGAVFDTLYRVGEWVPAGRPVVVILPPENLKVRAFVPEGQLGSIKVGDQLRVQIDGKPSPVSGRITFISPKAEYTPPVIYSRENRSKLVYMIELHFEPADATTLHPGQPVDVLWGK